MVKLVKQIRVTPYFHQETFAEIWFMLNKDYFTLVISLLILDI